MPKDQGWSNSVKEGALEKVRVEEGMQNTIAMEPASYLSLSMKCNCLVENKTNVINVSGTCW